MQKELSKYTFYLSQVSITLHIECQTMVDAKEDQQEEELYSILLDIFLIFQKSFLTIECKQASGKPSKAVVSSDIHGFVGHA